MNYWQSEYDYGKVGSITSVALRRQRSKIAFQVNLLSVTKPCPFLGVLKENLEHCTDKGVGAKNSFRVFEKRRKEWNVQTIS